MIRRLLIIVAIAVLAVLLFQQTGGDEDNPVSQEDLRKQLEETITKEWDALVAADWLTVYEIMDPTQKPDLTMFMQGRDRFYFKNWKLLDLQIDGLMANAQIQHDWGVKLDIEIDVGTPEKKGAVKQEVYRYDEAAKKWYHQMPAENPQRRKN